MPYALLAFRALHAIIMPFAHLSACVPFVQRFVSLMVQITYTLTSLIVRDTAPLFLKTLVSYAYYVSRVFHVSVAMNAVCAKSTVTLYFYP